jgi:ribulose-phosphate 3-epimerase
MIEEPSRYAVQFVEAGADMVSVHVEADTHLQRTLVAIREAGAEAGVAINPATSLSTLEEILPYADFILLMSVNPGFGGQSFIPTSMDKIRRLRDMIIDRDLKTKVEVDGGIDVDNIQEVVDMGGEIIVAGSAVFGKGDPKAGVRSLLEHGAIWI